MLLGVGLICCFDMELASKPTPVGCFGCCAQSCVLPHQKYQPLVPSPWLHVGHETFGASLLFVLSVSLIPLNIVCCIMCNIATGVLDPLIIFITIRTFLKGWRKQKSVKILNLERVNHCHPKPVKKEKGFQKNSSGFYLV